MGRVRGSHKPRVFQRKFHNCTEYTEHCINGIIKQAMKEEITKLNRISSFIPKIENVKKRKIISLRFLTNVTYNEYNRIETP